MVPKLLTLLVAVLVTNNICFGELENIASPVHLRKDSEQNVEDEATIFLRNVDRIDTQQYGFYGPSTADSNQTSQLPPPPLTPKDCETNPADCDRTRFFGDVFTRYCHSVSTTNTKNATKNTCQCTMNACAGQTGIIRACGCQGPVKIRVFESLTNTELKEGENIIVDYGFCGDGCPTYVFQNLFAFPCREFEIHGGCINGAACSFRLKTITLTITSSSISPRLLSAIEDSSQLQIEDYSQENGLQILGLEELNQIALEDISVANNTDSRFGSFSSFSSFSSSFPYGDDINSIATDDAPDSILEGWYPYLETTCRNDSYSDSGFLSIKMIVFVIVVPLGALCCLFISCLGWIKAYHPELLFACITYLRVRCCDVGGWVRCCLYGVAGDAHKETTAAIAPFDAGNHDTTAQNNRGHHDQVEEFPGAHDLIHDHDDNDSIMGELDDNDPRLLRRLESKYQRIDAQVRKKPQPAGMLSNENVSRIVNINSQGNNSAVHVLNSQQSVTVMSTASNEPSVFYDEEMGEVPLVTSKTTTQ